MPISRPRHVITETDDVARALDDAARRWPADAHNRTTLLRRLLAEGHRAVVQDEEAERADRRRAAESTSGVLTGAYAKGYLRCLGAEWPE